MRIYYVARRRKAIFICSAASHTRQIQPVCFKLTKPLRIDVILVSSLYNLVSVQNLYQEQFLRILNESVSLISTWTSLKPKKQTLYCPLRGQYSVWKVTFT
ncbi:MAG: hypothetical protein AAGA75_18890, partial [Cyanobacteria bacterium P01_E01_bin.6]